MIETQELFADIDRMDAAAFASYMSETCVLRFANAEEVVGREAIEAAIAGFFQSIGGLTHCVLEQWEVDETTIVRVEVTYTRVDGDRLTLPAVVIFRRGAELIDDYRIYIDQTPLYA